MTEQLEVLPKGRAAKLAWLHIAGWSVLIGVVSLRYALPRVPHPATLPNFLLHRRVLVVHATSASIALLLGPWQFLSGLRRRHPGVHRWMGRFYATALLVAAVAALRLAPTVSGGLVSTAGFGLLALGWLYTTCRGIIAIRRHQVASHRRWMVRSFALTAAAITLRIYVPASGLLHIPFVLAYPAIAWLCWVPNLLVAEVYLRRNGGQDHVALEKRTRLFDSLDEAS